MPKFTKVLTARQTEILNFIKQHINNAGYPPTVREIGKAFGIASPNGVTSHLKALERKGVIERDAHMSRAMRIVSEPLKMAIGGTIENKLVTFQGDTLSSL